jgi:hypothetical protein
MSKNLEFESVAEKQKIYNVPWWMHSLLMALTSKNFCLCEGRGTYWLKQNIVLPNVVYLDA